MSKIYKPINIELLMTVLNALVLIVICLLYAMSFGHYVNFYPINGTFQNFNPVRRLLAGQIPYRDFQDYLGMGHLFSGAIATFATGGGYRESLMAFSFLTLMGFSMICVVIGSAIFHKKSIVLATTNIVLVMMITQPLFYKNALVGMSEINDSLNYVLGTGNSARFIRGVILPLSCILFRFSYKLYNRIKVFIPMFFKYRNTIFVCGIGIISGFAFIWSNDYGISCWVCSGIMTFIIILARTKKFIMAILITIFEIIVSILSIFLFVELFTLGHFTAWFDSIFGTGGYQSWYYNGDKSYYLFDIEISFLILFQLGICIIYLILILRNSADRASLSRYGILAYFNMVSFCAVNEYRLLSGGYSKEVALTVLFITILFEICYIFKSFLHSNKNVIYITVFTASLAWIGADIKSELIFWKVLDKEGEYIEALGGNITALGADLLNTSEFLGTNKFFATYASAQEVVSDIFQPSGTDYIIHVLGDNQRRKYLDCFENNEFKYTATMKEQYTDYEYWIERANWFFYRELYRNWHPVHSNTYELYWERNIEGTDNILSNVCSVSIEDLNNSTKKIIIQADQSVNGIADVYIDYKVQKSDSVLSKYLFQTMLHVANTGNVFCQYNAFETNYLRSESTEFVPVRVVDGYGEITLTSSPVASTQLILNDVKCSDIYSVVFDYVECSNIYQTEKETIVSVPNNIKFQTCLKNINKIIIDEKEYPVSSINNDDQFLYLIILNNVVDDDLNEITIKHNNVLKVLKNT